MATARLRILIEALEGRRYLSGLNVVVNSVGDTADPPGSLVVSFRDAVTMANSSAASVNITFDPNTFLSAQTVVLTRGQLTLSNTSVPIAIVGPTAGVTISGNNASRVLQVNAGVTASFSNVTIANGKVSGNAVPPNWGGGILNSGKLIFADGSIINNSASYVGGGIYNSETSGAVLVLTNVTVAGNTSGSDGGGVFNDQTAILTDVTVSGNTAQDGGGIISNAHPEIITSLYNVTVANNSAVNNGGGMWNAGNAGQANASNTILASNMVTGSGSVGPDAHGSFTSFGHNLIGKSDSSSGWTSDDLVGTIASPLNANLGTLTDNGGATMTVLPQPGSPAVDAGSNTVIPSGIVVDQRGLPRIAGSAVDIGAVEVQPSTPQAPVISTANNTVFGIGNINSFTVVAAGYPVATLSEGGGLPSGVSFVDQGNGTAFLSGTPGVGTDGTYTFTITASNSVQLPATQSFSLIVTTTNNWISPLSGDWDTVKYWSAGHVPTADETAVINVPGTYLVTHSAGNSDAAHSIFSTAPLSIVAGTLDVATTLQVNNALSLSGGTLQNATIVVGNGGTLTATAGTLSALTIDGNSQISGNGTVTVTGSLTLNGVLSLGNSTSIGAMNITGSQALSGSGTVIFGSAVDNTFFNGAFSTFYNGLFVTTVGTTLTIGSGVTVRGQLGYLGYSGTFPTQGNNGGAIDNGGTIEADVSGGSITIGGTGDQNSGNLKALNGAVLSIPNSIANTGTVTVDGSSNLTGGTLSGGTLAVQTGANLYSMTLDAVTANGNFQVIGNNSLTITDGLNLNGTLSLGNATSVGYLNFTGSQMLGGSGTVIFGSDVYHTFVFGASGTYFNGLFDSTSSTTLTIGSGVTVRGQLGYLGYSGTFPTQGNNGGAIDNGGTIEADVSGGSITIGGTGDQNSGTVVAQGNNSLLNLQGSWTNTGVLKASDDGTLSPASGAVIHGGTIALSNGGSLPVQALTLNEVTVKGNLLVPMGSTLTVYSGLTLDGTLQIMGSVIEVIGSQTFAGNGTISLQSSAGRGPQLAIEGTSTLTIGSGITLVSGTGGIGTQNLTAGTNVLANFGTINSDIVGQTLTIQCGSIVNSGVLEASSGGNLTIPHSISINERGVFMTSPGSILEIGGNTQGNTSSGGVSELAGLTTFNGPGTSAAPQQIEAMSTDLGPISSGLLDNFVIGTLSLSGNDYAQLVDQSQNSSAGGANAVYAQSVIIPPGATLDLNGLHLYAREVQIDGQVLGGTITQIPDAGSLALATSTAGKIGTPGELDEWRINELGGRTITVFVNPGTTGMPSPISPQLQWAKIALIDPNGNVISTASDSLTSGAPLTLSNVNLLTDGLYKIDISAAAGHTASTGNYLVSVSDVTPNVRPLNLNQISVGKIATPFAVDQWNFSATPGAQVHLNILNTSAAGMEFSLTGPGGVPVFTNLTASSSLIDLSASGGYMLSVTGANGSVGSYSFNLTQTNVTTLQLGATYNGIWAGGGDAQLFAIPVTESSALSIALMDPSPSDHIELYASFGAPPTRQVYGYAANGGGANQNLLIPNANPGTWYLLSYASSVSVLPATYTLQARTNPLVLSSVTPNQSAANVETVMTLTGAGFDSQTSVTLTTSTGAQYLATSAKLDLPTQLTATFAAGTVPAGVYSVVVNRANGASAEIPNALTMGDAGHATLSTHLELPNPMGRHTPTTIFVDFANTGTVAMQAPLLTLSATNPLGQQGALLTMNPALRGLGLFTSATPIGFSQTVQILGCGSTPGVLQPGESRRVPVYYDGWLTNQWDFSNNTLNFSLQVIQANDLTPIDWSTLQPSLQPKGVSSTAWTAVYSVMQMHLGTTAGGYVRLLDNEASYLGQLGENAADVQSLWGLAIQQANNSLSPMAPFLVSTTDASMATPGALSLSFDRVFAEPITGRDTMSSLGMGWSTSWQASASVDIDGTVTITGPGGAQRIFQPESSTPGAYLSQPGDSGELSADGAGGYLLTDANGIASDFAPGGQLSYVKDTDNNRIILNYIDGRLTSLIASSGQSLSLSYTAAGLISAITDSAGRTTLYRYDPSNTYLVSVTTFDGRTTSYSYITDSSSLALNSLAIIAFPGGTHQYFTYNDEGALAGSCRDGGAQAVSFTYSLGQVNTTDGTGDTSTDFYNENGQIAKSVDPLGHPTFYTFDGSFNLASITNAFGYSETFSYNSAGELVRSTDFLGNSTFFTYTSAFNQLASMTDGNGNVTSYAYDGSGNLLRTTYANGTFSTSSFDPQGSATSFINANGQPISYTYNLGGQILSESFADGSSYQYSYDAYGNMLTATDATGTTTFTYNSTDQMTEVAYPNGMFLQFAYNAAGQRTQMVDQTGFTTNYIYDAAGRLSQLTDGNGNVIVTYAYDIDGRLSRKDNGNGTYATYQYDGDGNVLSLINYAPSGAINSSFVYSYNALGLETSETTMDGYWLYAYDANGQLIDATFTPNSEDPGGLARQDLKYAYDPMGNRTSTTINGITTAYVVNNMNQYSQVGGVSYLYDGDGNLISDGSTTYTFNALNQLVGISGQNESSQITYNSLGQRIGETTNGISTRFLVDPVGIGNIVGQFTVADGVIAKYVYGVGLAEQQDHAGILYYDFDSNANTVDLTDGSGGKISAFNYLPFGETATLVGVDTRFKFSGQAGVQEDAKGLSLVGARFVVPGLGRFLTPDPTDISEPNLYAYVQNNPTTSIDPSGLISVKGVIFSSITILGGVVGAVASYAAIPFTGGASVFPALASSYAIGVGIGNLINAVSDVDPVLSGGVFGDLGNLSSNPGVRGLGSLLDIALSSDVTPNLAATASFVGKLGNVQKFSQFSDLSKQIFEQGERILHAFAPSLKAGINGDTKITRTVNVQDPNSMLGPSGFGATNFVADGGTFEYQINFENSPTASAPVQEVTINDPLSANLDWNTFELTGIGWGNMFLTIPVGSQYFEATVPMTFNGQTFDVEVEAGIQAATGLVYASFMSIDPATGLPPSNPLIGFLPPEKGDGSGEGFVSFSVAPQANLATGTQIGNIGYISFDQGLPLATDLVDDEDPSLGTDPAKNATVTIDSGLPTSSVSVLPATEDAASFLVQWSGQGDFGGSGIASYNIYVSDDGGPYTLFQTNTSATSAIFEGEAGHDYSFYSVATDNVGNVEPTPLVAQATTTVAYSPQFSSLTGPQSLTFGTLGVTLSGILGAGTVTPLAGETVAVTLNGLTQNAIIQADGSFSTTFDVAALPASAAPYAVTYSYAGDTTFNAAQDTTSTTVTIIPATPTINVSDAGGAADGSAYSATATIAGVGTDVTSSSALEGVGLTLAYYSGTYTSLSQLLGLVPLAGAPSAAGDYTVLASFAGSIDYAAAATLANFTITSAAPSLMDVTSQLNITRSGYVYNIKTRTYTQTLTITNTGGALTGPVALLFGSLGNAMLVNALGKTTVAHGSMAAGSSYLSLAASLAAGQSLTVTLQFSSLPPSYLLTALEGSGTL